MGIVNFDHKEIQIGMKNICKVEIEISKYTIVAGCFCWSFENCFVAAVVF
jgi:hypothetical protein